MWRIFKAERQSVNIHMMNIRIVAVGSMKSQELADLVDEYVKRLRPFARIEIVEVAHEAFRDIGEKDKAQRAEAARIEKQLRGHVVYLEERGKELSSETFATWISKMSERGEAITFVLGGALGIHPAITKNAERLSLSPLTFPHEMARMILCEQIYRAACIMSGKSYHY